MITGRKQNRIPHMDLKSKTGLWPPDLLRNGPLLCQFPGRSSDLYINCFRELHCFLWTVFVSYSDSLSAPGSTPLDLHSLPVVPSLNVSSSSMFPSFWGIQFLFACVLSAFSQINSILSVNLHLSPHVCICFLTPLTCHTVNCFH